MCQGLVVREITSPKSANALSAVARTVDANCRERGKFQPGFQADICRILGLAFRISTQQFTSGNLLHWATRSSALTTRRNHTTSFESLEHRLRCPTVFRFRETVGSIPSGGSPEVSQIQDGKEVK